MFKKKGKLYMQLTDGSWIFCRKIDAKESTPEELEKLSKRMNGKKFKVEQ